MRSFGDGQGDCPLHVYRPLFFSVVLDAHFFLQLDGQVLHMDLLEIPILARVRECN